MRESILVGIIVCAAAALIASDVEAAASVNVRDFGAVGDGQTLDTAPFNKAIDACARSKGGGVVLVPAGKYLAGTIRLKSDVTLHLDEGAELIATRDLSQYASFTPPKDTPLVGGRVEWHRAFILGDGVEDVSIVGKGVINGSNVTDKFGEEGTRGPHGVLFGNSKNVAIRDVTITNAGNYAAMFEFTSGVCVERITVTGGYDGVHLRGWAGKPCLDVRIVDCKFYTGDDCVAGWHWEDVRIEKCVMNSACNGIRLFGPAKKVVVQSCEFFGPGKYPWRTAGLLNWRYMASGVCIQPSAWGETPGIVDDVRISDVTMNNVATPVHVVNKGPSEIGHVTVERLTATNVYRSAVSFESWNDKPIGRIDFRDSNIQYLGGIVRRWLNPIEAAQVLMMADSIDEITEPGIDSRPLPVWGLYARHVKSLNVSNVKLSLKNQTGRPAVMLDGIDELNASGLNWPNQGADPMVTRDVKKVVGTVDATKKGSREATP